MTTVRQGLCWRHGICVLLVLLVATGCSLRQIHEQTTKADNVASVEGTVERLSGQQGKVIVVHFRDENGIPALEKRLFAKEDGSFQFWLAPGRHYFAAYIDASGDSRFQPDKEDGAIHGLPTAVTIAAKERVMLPPLAIRGKVSEELRQVQVIDKTGAAWHNIGKVTSLEDPRFNRDFYSMGLWRPVDFLQEAEGGLFLLRPFAKGEMPVLFIHGVLGGPTDLATPIKALEGKSFQPLAAYYPSGLRLDIISDYLLEAINRLQRQHGFTEFGVVAHSMGGLVCHSFVKKYVEQSEDNASHLKFVMTINSPLGGVKAAAAGLRNSPIIVPSWRDVEPDSEFLSTLHQWPWPDQVPYYLVASYESGDSSDGVIALESQLPLPLQREAQRVTVFNNSHVGTLNAEDFIAEFAKLLDQLAP